LANFEKKKRNDMKRGKSFIFLFIFYLSLTILSSKIWKAILRDKKKTRKKEKLEEAIGGSTERAGGPSRKRSEW
jgi:hypothetical protein